MCDALGEKLQEMSECTLPTGQIYSGKSLPTTPSLVGASHPCYLTSGPCLLSKSTSPKLQCQATRSRNPHNFQVNMTPKIRCAFITHSLVKVFIEKIWSLSYELQLVQYPKQMWSWNLVSPPAQKGYWFASMLACFMVLVHIRPIEAVQHAILSKTKTLVDACCMVMIRIFSKESELPAEPGFSMQSGVKHQLWLLSASWLWYKCSSQKLNIQWNQDHRQSCAKINSWCFALHGYDMNSLYRSWMSNRAGVKQ